MTGSPRDRRHEEDSEDRYLSDDNEPIERSRDDGSYNEPEPKKYTREPDTITPVPQTRKDWGRQAPPDDLVRKARDLRSEYIRDAGRKIKRLILDTPIEVFAFAAIGVTAAGITSYYNEAAKQGQIPVAYAELEQIVYDAKNAGRTVPPLTYFYSVANNAAMEVFEANNISYTNGQGGTDLAFALALDEKLRTRRSPYARLGQYAQDMPSYAKDALGTLSVLDRARADIVPVANALDKAWDEYHRDVYETVHYTEQECDFDGKNCRMVSKTREEYDYTIHSYTYHPEYGQLAARLLADFARKYPDIRINETLLTTNWVGDGNKDAIYDSRKDLPDFEELTNSDYVQMSNVWANGSNYNVLLPQIYGNHSGVLRMTPEWQRAEPSSESHRYRTYSRSDSGPAEFQIAEAALDYAVAMARKMQNVTGGIRFAQTNVPELDRKVRDYVIAMLESPNGSNSNHDFGAMRSDIMKTARDVYSQNYAGGFDVYPVKWYMVLVWSVIGLLAGGALGFGVDRGLERLEEEGVFDEKNDAKTKFPNIRPYS